MYVTSGDTPGLMTVVVPFTFGTEFVLSGQLKVDTLATGALSSANIWAWSRAEFGHTAYIDGITEVFAANDEAVNGFTITSLSGADYIEGFESAAVPKPATYAVAFGVLALAVALARRRR